ncbi:hypothetical protein T02_971 [Trichinella nativa]|uniref:Uncharacterized protein n=1 Tax=Trichinella nativa TaxID=6335 RepID=A0A0V1KWJ1_9BILA|nr:hypothetical protein T09_15729 [Trichinella sp. T9]KRZ51696.1 hypothetical protein T02_971 [Trichinella nativa]
MPPVVDNFAPQYTSPLTTVNYYLDKAQQPSFKLPPFSQCTSKGAVPLHVQRSVQMLLSTNRLKQFLHDKIDHHDRLHLAGGPHVGPKGVITVREKGWVDN